MVVRFNTEDVTIHLASAGCGKAGWVDAVIPTPDGYKRFGSLKVGDRVFSAEGKPVKVTGVYPRGIMDAYKVTLSDGRSSICAADHLWGVYTQGHRELTYKVMSLEEMLAKGVRRPDARRNRALGQPKFFVPASPVCEYDERPLPVDPYVLGSFIGNGCLTEKYLTLSSNDEWQVGKVAALLDSDYVKRSEHNYSWDFYRNGRRIRTEDVISFEHLRCTAEGKYIPSEYFTASVKSRIKLLQGLFDTDGSVSIVGNRLHVTYSTVSSALATGLRQLLLSFGIVSTIREDKRDGRNICYELIVNCDTKLKELLFSLPRKVALVKNFKRDIKHHYDRVAIRSIEKLPQGREMQCIMVDDPAHLYLCEDFIVTHNTTTAMQIISEALGEYRPDEIAFVTYTRKGVETGIERALAVNKELTPDDLMHFKTLHALCFRESHLARKNIITKEDIDQFNAELGFHLTLSDAFGHVTEDDRLLQRYDAERSGSKRGVFVDGNYDRFRYERLINAYKAFKEGHDLVDFYDCLLRYMEDGEPLQGVKIALIDECQDLTPLQWQVCMKAFSEAEKVICLGDDFQCQPAGTKVLTKDGYVPIENCQGKSAITFSMKDYAYYGKQHADYPMTVAHRHYQGPMIEVTAEGCKPQLFTPEHRMLVRWNNRDTSLRCVYLMKKGDWFRVGQCQLFNKQGATHFILRMNNEGAEAGWILKLCHSEEEALVWEQYFSLTYGIPQISWKMWHGELVGEVYKVIGGNMAKRADYMLDELYLNLYLPMFNHEKAQAKSGGSCMSLCEACNLLPEIMSIPVYYGEANAKKDKLWKSFKTDVQWYDDEVYSLDVPKYHTYVTEGGLTVHNCLYTYNGAAPELLVEMASHYRTIKHEISYRLPRKVYEFSKGITDLIQEKVEKNYAPAKDKEGFVETVPDRSVLARKIRDDLKANGAKPGRWFLLFRTNCFIADMSMLMEQFIVPYHTSKGFCIPERELSRIERYYNYRKQGFGSDAAKKHFMEEYKIEDINDSFMHSELIPGKERYFFQDLVDTWGIDMLKEMSKMSEPFCLLSTVHRVKGGEADFAAMFMDCTRVVSENITLNADEELRVLYVGCTRCREGLYIVPSSGKYSLSRLLDIVKELNDD